jgi:protein-L-isoaspartate(D-aspartate) O-methyltransferase
LVRNSVNGILFQLLDQLAPGGRLIMPIGEENGTQKLTQLDKLSDGSAEKKALMSVRYMPLTTREHQLNR